MNILTSLPLFLIDYRTINLGIGLAATVMGFWQKRKNKLVHDYSLVGYILSPNPTIMAHAIDNKTLEHDAAAERLITKLLLTQLALETRGPSRGQDSLTRSWKSMAIS